MTKPGTSDVPRTYTVDAGSKLADVWSTVPARGEYDLMVSGPNGFLRRFSGDARVAAGVRGIAPEVSEAYGTADGGSIVLTFTNPGTKTVRLTVAPNAYGGDTPRVYSVAPGATVEGRWNLKASLRLV